VIANQTPLLTPLFHN